MTHVLADNVRESSVSTGTGAFTTTGGIGATPTAPTGRILANVASTGDTFDYVIHHVDANEWEVGIGTYSSANTFTRTRVVSSSNAGSAVDFSAGNKVIWIGPSSEIQNYFANLYNVRTFGATPGGSNSTAINAAKLAAGDEEPIFLPGAKGQSWGAKASISDNGGQDAGGEGSGFSLIAGSDSAPYTSSKPIVYIEAHVDSTEATQINHHAGFDVRVKKVDGDKNVYTVYAAMEDVGGQSFGVVSPLFCCLTIDNDETTANALYHGIQVYVDKSTAPVNAQTRGIDVLLNDTSGVDIGWQLAADDPGVTEGARYAASGRATFGHVMGRNQGGAGYGFYTGFFVDVDSIMPYSYSNNAEAFRIRGGSSSGNKYQGIWIQDGHIKNGINFVGPTYENGSVILSPKDTRFIYGTTNAASTYTTWTSGDLFNVQGGTLAINGLQVAKERITGWTTPSGVSTRTGFTTSSATAAQVGEALKALIEDLKTHGLIGA